MKVIKVFTSLILTLLMMCSCRKEDAPKIYSFQRMETVWDKMLLSDMQREASSVTSVDFQFNIADDTQEQIAQIQSAVRRGGIDAIIVNPFDKESLVPVIEEAYDAGVFVVLVGQMIPTFKYHAYSGIDNRVLGDMAAKYICKLLDGKGNVVLIHSFRDAPFYRERTEAFDHVMNHYPEINIVGQVDAQWDKEKAHLMMDSLKVVLGDSRVDLVYSFGDMVMGAVESGAYPNAFFVGTDGVPGECLEGVLDGSLNATFYNPTGGYQAVNAAVCLIKGLPFEKEQIIQPTLVTADNAGVITNNLSSMLHYEQKIDLLNHMISDQKHRILTISRILMILIFIVPLLTVGLVHYLNKTFKHRQTVENLYVKSKELNEKYEEIALEKEISDRMRVELELEREALLDAGVSLKETGDRDVLSEAVFMKLFSDIAAKHIGDSSYSIDNLASDLGVSRAQLFRKVKNESGSTPNELIQSMRLEKARIMLRDGGYNISEVAFAVGFTSPSYFSKCYKDRFGTAPKDFS